MAGLHDAIQNAITELDAAVARKDPVWGLPTGFPRLDLVTGGLHEGETTIVGARPSIGKSSIISQISFNVSVHLFQEMLAAGDPTGQALYFSPEMLAEDLVRRQASQITEVPLHQMRSGELDEEALDAVKSSMRSLGQLGQVLQVFAGSRLELTTLYDKAFNAHRMGPPVRFIAVDYLTRIDAGERLNDYAAANKISRTLKDLALGLKCPIVVGAQLSRRGERSDAEDPAARYPRLEDLRDSGKIEEDADNVWLLHRDRDPTRTIAEDEPRIEAACLIIAKARNGRSGLIELGFEPHLTRFSDGADLFGG